MDTNTLFLKRLSRRNFLHNTTRFCCQAGMASLILGPAGAMTAARPLKAASRATDFEPAYLKLHQTGELRQRAETLWGLMDSCRLCPRECGVNRLRGMTGICQSPGTRLFISSAMPHFGEERPLVGRGGSGTIFLTHCSLRCVFCQNWEISQLGRGFERSIEEMAGMMLQLQRIGCHNINVVTPSHYSAAILKTLDIAAAHGLRIPLVYNTCGWERMEVLEMLDGIVDIYLPDFKFWDEDLSVRLTEEAGNYPEITKKAILEMHRQVGVAKPDEKGIMHRGLMLRHLVMPNDTSGSIEIMEWVAENLPHDTYVNIMAQYNPMHKAYDHPEIARRITAREYRVVVDRARELGLTNLDVQGHGWFRR